MAQKKKRTTQAKAGSARASAQPGGANKKATREARKLAAQRRARRNVLIWT